ncbi:MAG TPA: endo-1,4-beta-xylanase [Candidatus Hydrogenedentes bacterium]|mgnify:CR=1 FL=1|nr:endo-1,4-beta-xylanase [Candidatus Hydrogenedentota bacterium]
MNKILGAVFIGIVLCASIAAGLTVETKNAAVKPFLSGGNLTTNGKIAVYARIQQPGACQVVVRAYGSPSGGEWPLMALSVNGFSPNGFTFDPVTVNTDKVKDYVFTVTLTNHVHCIGVAFLNDGWRWGEDRNLYLETITVKPPEGAPDPVLATEEEWKKDGPVREEAAVKESEEGIKKNRVGEASIRIKDAQGNPAANVEIALEQTRHDFLFGSNICAFDAFHNSAKDDTYKQHFANLFNYATLPFYWRLFEPVKGQPAYAAIDAMAKWCKDHNIQMKAHPLLYDHEAGIPPWSALQPAAEIQKEHVVDTMQHYKDQITYWEVVNEPVNAPGVSVDPAFRWARETVPTAKLVINEYGIFYEGYPKFYQFIEKTIQDGVPFDVIGIQAHAPDDWAFPLDGVRMVLDHYATFKKSIHITELTPCSNNKPVQGSPWRTAWNEEQQADYAEKLYRVCFAHPAVGAISWWDFTDVNAWKTGGGMLRNDLTPKPVYERLHKLIHETWHTTAQGTTDANGLFKFSGFYGDYRVTLKHNGQTKETELHFPKGTTDTLLLPCP